jgi:hypothetical protein
MMTDFAGARRAMPPYDPERLAFETPGMRPDGLAGRAIPDGLLPMHRATDASTMPDAVTQLARRAGDAHGRGLLVGGRTDTFTSCRTTGAGRSCRSSQEAKTGP